MPKRTRISGLGADAFFSPEQNEATTDEQAGTTSKPSRQLASKTVSQQLVKATFYITPEHITVLEELKLKLRKNGEVVDKSELIRRAIELLAKQQNSLPS